MENSWIRCYSLSVMKQIWRSYLVNSIRLLSVIPLFSLITTSIYFRPNFGVSNLANGSSGFASYHHGYQSFRAAVAGTESSATEIYLPVVRKPPEKSWPMAAANPQRTSWTPEEVKGGLEPLWFKVFEPYILPRVQIIAAYGTLYISTARGLYALDAASGNQRWVYPTALPLGHSPTISDGVAYVGGFDHKIHAIDALTGKGLWTFEAGAGFDTNPLVVEGLILAGNRDGFFYAIHAKGANTGTLAWKFQTQGPIHFSAAYKDGEVYFASDDSYAYALNAQTGNLIWKSSKLPGSGFHSWWPVVYGDYVIIGGSHNYRQGSEFGGGIDSLEEQEIYPNLGEDPPGTFVGPLGHALGGWVAGTLTIDTRKPNVTENGSTNPITEYFEQKPWRRTYLVLNRASGKEYTTDFDNDGLPEYAPILWFGKASGNRYPPVVGSDGILYQANNYMSDPTIPWGQVSGWQIGSPYISIATSSWNAVDEPIAFSAGGNLIFWNRCCDRVSAAFDISIPYSPDAGGVKREWSYYSYNLHELIPGYNQMYYNPIKKYTSPYASFGGRNGVYGFHGDVNPPIPYRGKVYMHRSNAVIAFAPQAGDPIALPMAKTLPVQEDGPTVSKEQLVSRLEAEVEAILEAGHLRPGYSNSGAFDRRAGQVCGDGLVDYWHYPGDITYTLIRALPHLRPDLQQQTREYIQSEFENYPPSVYNHIGWRDGAAREIFDTPVEVQDLLASYPPETQSNDFSGWKFAPHAFYAMWKYAEEFGGAKDIFDAAKARLEPVPPDDVLEEMPHVHNAFIAGYIGFLELEKLAGYPESANIRIELNRLMQLRASTFSKEAPAIYFEDFQKYYCRTINVSRNFMYLVPEMGQYLHDNAYQKVQEAVNEYETLAPYWFVSRVETAFGEAVITPLLDYHALFQAKALILQQPYEELTKYIDVPAVAVGDLFYIQNMISAIEAVPMKQSLESSSASSPGLTCRK
jgi:outer membrane protein assembly factor BamB